MEYRILGRTGLRVSAVALGCEGFIHKTPEEVCADFDFAIGHGVNFVDIYSPNPELRTNIGAALEGRRGDFVIQGHLCTTWENGQYLRTRDPEKTLASFDLQLQQLRTDCLDIGMIHYVDAEADFHRVFGGEIIRIAQRLREEGRIRHIGISSHNPAVARMAVETGLVDYLAAGAKTDQIGGRFTPGFVVVKEGVNHRMPGEKRDGFGQVDDRVQNRGVDAQSFGMFQRKISEKIHKSLESDHRVGTVVEGGDMFGRGAAFEPLGAELPPSGIVAEPDGEKGAAVYLVADFAAECRGDRRDDAARDEITDQCRMTERVIGKDAECGDGG